MRKRWTLLLLIGLVPFIVGPTPRTGSGVFHIIAAVCTDAVGVLNQVCVDSSAGDGDGLWRCTATACAGANWDRIDDTTGGAELNDLENQAPANIATTEILVGTGVGTAVFVAMSSDILMDNGGVVTIQALAVDSAEIAVGAVDENHLASPLAFDATDLLDFSGIDASTATEGLILPQIASACVAATAEGQICWDTAGEDLYIGNDSAAVQMNVGSEVNDLEIIANSAGDAEIFVGTGANAGAYITGLVACDPDAKIEYLPGSPDTFLCEAISGLVDADVSDTLTSSLFVGSGSTTTAIDLATAEAAGTLTVAKGGTGVTSSTGTVAVVLSTSPTLISPDLGTPSAGVMTNATGTAAGLTAGAVTTNANLTGHVTSTGNAAILGAFTKDQLNTAISDAVVPGIGDTETISGAWDWTDTGTFDFAGPVTATSFTADSSTTPTLSFDDDVAAGIEARIVANATADNNGDMELQVEDADGVYKTGMEVKSTGGAVVVRIGGDATSANHIAITEAGALTGEGTATIEADALAGTIPVTVNLAANLVDAIGELDGTIRSGSDVTVITGTFGGSGLCAEWNADGDLIEAASAAACGSGGAHAGTITWTGTPILDHGAAISYGISDEATITHTYATSGANDPILTITDDSVAWTNSAAFLVEGNQVILASDTVTALTGVTTMTDTQFCQGNASTGFDCDVAGALDDDDYTDDNTVVFGSGTFTTMSFNAGATDPLFTFGSDSLAITNAATFTNAGNAILDATSTVSALTTVGSVDTGNWGSTFTADLIDADDLADDLVFEANSLLNLSTTDPATALAGLYLPQQAGACVGAVEEGSICWDSTNKDLYIGDDTTPILMNGAAPATEVRSMNWGAGSMNADGCTAIAEVAIPSAGFPMWTSTCPVAATSQLYGSTTMPDSWDAGNVLFEVSSHHAVSEVLTCIYDITCQCVGTGEAMNTTFTTEGANTVVVITTAALTDQFLWDEQVGAIACTGTCSAGDLLRWELESETVGTGANCANTNILGVKMEYTSTIGD